MILLGFDDLNESTGFFLILHRLLPYHQRLTLPQSIDKFADPLPAAAPRLSKLT